MLSMFLFLVIISLASQTSMAFISQNQLFSDNMVLLSAEAVDVRPFVSGFGDTPGEKVNVTFQQKTYPVTVGNDGKWVVQMDSCYGAPESEVLEVKGEQNTLTYKNVACGQVFVCSGQSNMDHVELQDVFGMI